MLIDTGDVGADAGVALENALRTLEERGLVPGRAAWLGVVAGSGSKGESASGDTLARTLARVLGEDVQAPVHRHEWSQHHAHISGPAVIEPVQASWTRSRGGRPASAADGPTPQVFEAPAILPYPTPGPLVRAAQGMDPDLEDRFFTGRHRVLSDIAHWLEDRQPGIFLLTGAPGSGKSAVLGRIVALSDPLQRADLLAHGALRPGDPDPGVNTVDVSLRLSGLTVHQLASAVADGLGLPRPPTPSSLIADLERGWSRSGQRLVIVMDGLDEAAPYEADGMLDQLLAPLSRQACLLVGSRDRPLRSSAERGESLSQVVVRLFGSRARHMSLDEAPEAESDIEEYSRRRLQAEGLPLGEAAAASRVIARQATQGHGGFLFARVAADSVIRRHPAGPEDWEQAVPGSVRAALAQDLEKGPTLVRDGQVVPHAARDLLTALAWSSGNGLPARGIWEATATAISDGGTSYGPADLDWLLGAYGRYVVEDTDGDQPVYRLYHQALVGHLRDMSAAGHRRGRAEPAYRVARALVDLLLGHADDARTANPYLRRALPEHALMAEGRGIDLVRELVETRGDAFRPDLAQALTRVAASLSEAGRWAEAVAPSQEATWLYRELTKGDRGSYLPDLAMSLNNLAIHQTMAGDRQGALVAATEAASLHRTLADSDPSAYLPDLAASLNSLARSQAQSGDRHGALATITEAVTIRRSLAHRNSASYVPELAASLNNLAVHQAAAGDRHGALSAITEATYLYRSLAEENPALYLPDLAASLNNLAVHQAAAGDRHGALSAITEATYLYRSLAEENPALYLPDLAASLNNLANQQADVGDHHGALTAITEAVIIRRNLAEENPAAHLPDLAASLNNLANQQADVGDHHGALTAITEAVIIRRNLAEENPAAHLPDLAASLNNLANQQADVGDHHGALTAITEAVALLRNLAQADPHAHLPHLADALNNLAAHQAGTGDSQSALATATEAVGYYRALAAHNPAAHLPHLAGALNNLARSQTECGEPDAALAAISEAVGLYRTLAQDNPAAHLPHLAGALNNLSVHRAVNGDRQSALASVEEAVAIRRAFAGANPAAHLHDLAVSLHNLAVHQAGTGDSQSALATATEAVGYYRALAAHNPAAHLPHLAGALNNLARSQTECGEPDAALAAISEAVGLYRTLAQDNPAAHLPHLTDALDNLSRVAPLELALTVHREAEQALGTHPEAARRLAVRRAELELTHADSDLGLSSLITLASPQQASEGEGTATFQARQRLRTHSGTAAANAERIEALWRELTRTEPPAWFRLSQETLDRAIEWIRCPTWAASRSFWDAHAEELQTSDSTLALEEIALTDRSAAEHLEIARAAVTAGPDSAFRPYLTAELLVAWTDLPTWEESQAYLTDHAEILLHELAVDLLRSDLDAPESAVGFAVLVLSRAIGIAPAYECVKSRGRLHRQVQLALASDEPAPEVLRAAALLELFVYQEDFTGAAHLALASVLDGSSHDPPSWPAAEQADRDRVIAEIASVMSRHTQHESPLGALIVSILAASPAS
ncbi:AAA family ATPase [Streptomyces spororaveus]|uniref:AAA family ATPase n=1 Tax=Streptomyces spororaveus TaxID=284039 RepID=UPI00378F93DA